MGVAITFCKYQKKDQEGRWVDVESPVDLTDNCEYSFYGWVGDVRNYSAIVPLTSYRGLPEDILKSDAPRGIYDDPDYSHTWLLVDELRAVDFDQIVEDRRVTINGRGDMTCEVGEGESMPLRDFLDEFTMEQLEALMASEVERVIVTFY